MEKIKMLKESTSGKCLCVCVFVVLCYNKNICTLRMAHGHVVKNNAYKSND